jgi:hypothetical protein
VAQGIESRNRLKEAQLKAQAMSVMYERRIAAQKESIDRLLVARDLSNSVAWGNLIKQHVEFQDEMLLHKATTQRIIDLLRAEEGARVINVDLLQAIIDDGAEQERLRREAFHG